MSKIDRRPLTPPASAPLPKAAVERAAPAKLEGDRLAVSGATRTAEQMRAISLRIEALLKFTPLSTAQAEAWMKKGQELHADAAPRLLNGDLKSLSLKERQTFMVNVHRLEHFLEDAPAIVKFIAGE